MSSNQPADQPGDAAARRAELAEGLHGVRERIAEACRAADRDPVQVRLLPVTKTFPASDAALLTDLGLTDFGENRVQEAEQKTAELAGLRPDAPARWHMVGRLQRNKARSVAGWAHQVQSVDSARLAESLRKAVGAALAAGERSEPLDVLLQVRLDEQPGRGGCAPEELAELAEGVARTSEIRLCGLMAVAPLGEDPEPAFARLAGIAERFRAEHPNATVLSAGMSGDLALAVSYGSTCVRVGTALLGHRRLTSR